MLLVIILGLVFFVTIYWKWKYTYWQRMKVAFIPPTIPFGNLQNPLRATMQIGELVKRMYDELKAKKEKHGGIYVFLKPIYLVVDLTYVKNILAKDFQHFVDRGVFYNEKGDPLSAHLFSMEGEKWRNLRIKLTPTFTSGKMKQMFETLVNCEENLLQKIETLSNNQEAIDIKEQLACYTTDVIGSCAFGLDCNSFQDEDSLFRKYGKEVFSPTPLRRMKVSLIQSAPKLAKALNFKLFPEDVTSFFMKVVKDTVNYREENNVQRKDFMNLLIELKNNKLAGDECGDGKNLSIEEIAAQSFIFFLAGFETSSTTMTFALYELAKHQNIQQKVRNEIKTVLAKYDGKICYEAIQEMKYMNQVLDETLRKYPPVPFLTRLCVQDYKVPDTDVIIKKGTRVFISVLGIHYDPEYYPKPEAFDPDRFSEHNSTLRHQFAHIPFGEGPRICIGLRFGLMQSKVGLTSLLMKYNFTLSDKTQDPLKFKVNSFILAAEGEVWLNANKI